MMDDTQYTYCNTNRHRAPFAYIFISTMFGIIVYCIIPMPLRICSITQIRISNSGFDYYAAASFVIIWIPVWILVGVCVLDPCIIV